MKTYNTIFTDPEAFAAFARRHGIPPESDQCLVQVFCGVADPERIRTIVAGIDAALPAAKLIGSTSSGGILPDGLAQDAAVVSVSVFDTVTVTTHFEPIEGDSLKAGRRLGRALSDPGAQLALVFCDGLKCDGEQVLKGINQAMPDVPIAGGRAGDSGNLNTTLVFDKTHMSAAAAVGASLSSPTLRVVTGYSLAWQPIGKDMTVTRAAGNRTYTVDGYTVRELYGRYLGKSIADDMPYSCGEFPLLKILDDGTTLARGLTQVFDDGSAILGGSLEEGDRVRLGFGNVNIVLSERDRAHDQLSGHGIDSLFVYSCTARLGFLQPEAAFEEIKPLSEIAPLAGFFTYGEFFHNQGQTELMNLTMTFVGLSEAPAPAAVPMPRGSRDESSNMLTGKHVKVLNALTTLVNRVTAELHETNNALERQASEDDLTGLANRRIFFERGEIMLRLAQRHRAPLTMCYLDLDDFKAINDSHGHTIGDEVLRAVSRTFRENLRASDLLARIGGEEFALLLSDTSLEGAMTLCESLRAAVASEPYTFNGVMVPVTISCGVAAVDTQVADLDAARRCADAALYRAKSSGKNRVMAFSPP